MCGIAGIFDISLHQVNEISKKLDVMKNILNHRGPDSEGKWVHQSSSIGFAHKRLSIIDLSPGGSQPMVDEAGNWIVFNGEIYNYIELREELGPAHFSTSSDTEVILAAYRKWGTEFVTHLRGMFAFAIWDENKKVLFCGRDRFGIKPFYYTVIKNTLYFASEIKALLPFQERIKTNLDGFKDYLLFQFCLAGKTLFHSVQELLPAHTLRVVNGSIEIKRYWEVYYNADFDHTAAYFEEKLRVLLKDSIKFHTRSDVPLGAYVSGGFDSSIIASLACDQIEGEFLGFTGKFSIGPEFDESHYAREIGTWKGFEVEEIDITSQDFMDNIRKVIYHLDYPVAGPGSFPQYMVSQLASRRRKVVLGGQGGDEIFGGYSRYLIAYFEQCIKAAIDGTTHNGNFIVTYESIIPNLGALKNYKPLLQEFWQQGLFEDMDKRYFRLVNRGLNLGDEIHWELIDEYSSFSEFQGIFNGENVGKQSYFDLMTHFDFKTLLPALLQVEDRMSMAHGLESRVPLLDHSLVEFAATIPADIKFSGGMMKRVFKDAFQEYLPESITKRKDKMGFPTPFTEWVNGDARDFVMDVFSCQKARTRDLIDNGRVIKKLGQEKKFGHNIWGLLCLELWQQEFHDKEAVYQGLLA